MSESDAPINEPAPAAAPQPAVPAVSFDKPAAGPAPASVTSSVTIGGAVAVLLVLIGSIGPWITVESVGSVNGTSGDGVITIVLAIIVGAFIAMRRLHRVGLGFAVLCLALSIYHCVHTGGDAANGLIKVSIGWGIVVATIGSIGLVAWAIVGGIQAGQTKPTKVV